MSGVTRAPELLERARSLPHVAARRAARIEQRNPSSCGPASLASVLTALGYARSEAEVTAVLPWSIAGWRPVGTTLGALERAARRLAPVRTTLLRPASEHELVTIARRASELDAGAVLNLHRRPLFGAGGGHHSPLGGLLEAEGLVLVLDVNSSYGEWLAPVPLLLRAVSGWDPLAGAQRGVLLVEHRASTPSQVSHMRSG